MTINSPNTNIRPASAGVNEKGHLTIAGLDTIELCEQFGTPLWIIDELTIHEAITAYKDGLSNYPDYKILYAGKAFLCKAMCYLLQKHGLGLDVVSDGELYAALKSSFPAEEIYMHGNNKSEHEIKSGLLAGDVKIVVDNISELHMIAKLSRLLKHQAKVLLRVTPDVIPDTHAHITTGHADSKFGMATNEIVNAAKLAASFSPHINLVGLHAHIGSQCHELAPYLESIEILGKLFHQIKSQLNINLVELDIGGGLGIAYNDQDKPLAINQWARAVSQQVINVFTKYELILPKLLIEPGRSIIGSAGTTIYRAGHKKVLPNGITYLAVDGGMADNPRPITYQAKYTAAVANAMNREKEAQPITLVGKYCESGDIIIENTYLSADRGDLIAIFGTGAYNYSMSSNYNRTARPACILASNNSAHIIIDRETNDDLLRHDKIPEQLLR